MIFQALKQHSLLSRQTSPKCPKPFVVSTTHTMTRHNHPYRQLTSSNGALQLTMGKLWQHYVSGKRHAPAQPWADDNVSQIYRETVLVFQCYLNEVFVDMNDCLNPNGRNMCFFRCACVPVKNYRGYSDTSSERQSSRLTLLKDQNL